MFFTLLIIQGSMKLLLILCLPCLAAVNRNVKMVFLQNCPCSPPQIPRENGGWEGSRGKERKRKKIKGEGRSRGRTILPAQEQYCDLSENSMKERELYRNLTGCFSHALGSSFYCHPDVIQIKAFNMT